MGAGAKPARRSALAFVRIEDVARARRTMRSTGALGRVGEHLGLDDLADEVHRERLRRASSSRPPIVSSRATAPPTRSCSGP